MCAQKNKISPNVTPQTDSLAKPHGKQKREPLPSLPTLFPEFSGKKYREQEGKNQEQFINELREAYKHRGLVLYIGAGVSTSLGLPTWPELIRSLTITMMTRKINSAINALESLKEEERWLALAAIQEDVFKYADYNRPILMMARAIKESLGEELPLLLARQLYRKSRIRSRFLSRNAKNNPGNKNFSGFSLPSSPLLESIVALARAERDVEGVQAIVNYNFDDFVDETLRRENVRCRTVLSGKDKVPAGTLACYHVHGVLPITDYFAAAMKMPMEKGKVKAKGNFVFSEDQYHAEYADPYKWSNMTQMSLLGRYTGLFIGLSMEDPNIRRLIDVTHGQYPEISNYAILPRRFVINSGQPSKQNVLHNLFEDVESNSFARIGVKVIWVNDYADIPPLLLQICDLGAT